MALKSIVRLCQQYVLHLLTNWVSCSSRCSARPPVCLFQFSQQWNPSVLIVAQQWNLGSHQCKKDSRSLLEDIVAKHATPESTPFLSSCFFDNHSNCTIGKWVCILLQALLWNYIYDECSGLANSAPPDHWNWRNIKETFDCLTQRHIIIIIVKYLDIVFVAGI
jgi:hypothetical protein